MKKIENLERRKQKNVNLMHIDLRKMVVFVAGLITGMELKTELRTRKFTEVTEGRWSCRETPQDHIEV